MATGLIACTQKESAEELRGLPGNTVRIVRDTYGVPHIYADTVFGLFYGYGYAVGQDRLFQMEMARRSTQGKVAEVLGPDYVDYDLNVRRGFSPASIRRQLDVLEAGDRDVFEGYAAGLNAWIRTARQDRASLMSKQFIDFGFDPENWTAYDVVMIFVGTLANRYADFNTEIENQIIYDELVRLHGPERARQVFDQLNPRKADTAPTTIPAADWQPLETTARNASEIRFSGLSAPKEISQSRPWGIGGMSNCFVLAKSKARDATAILVNGPQFGWFTPAYVYSVGLHGAGFDLVGNTPFALPAVLFGHNADIAWGSTWGAGDMVDLYRERLNPENSNEYWHDGEYRAMESRTEVIRVKDGQDVALTALRTVHGPVVQTNGKTTAIARKRTWDGREVESLLGWLHSTRASTHEEWLEQAERNALNINWYYADKTGNIAYVFTGKYPERTETHDNRFPASGEGGSDWRGLRPFLTNPKVTNPAQGFIANWNNKPANGVLNPDEFWYSWSTADRVDYLIEALRSQDQFGADEAWGLIEESSYADVNAPYFLGFIDEAAKDADDERMLAANELLQAWDLQSRDRDHDGFYDEPATAIFRSFLPRLIKAVLANDLGPAFQFFSATGYPVPGEPTAAGVNIQTGTKAIVENLMHGEPVFDFFNGEPRDAVIRRVLGETIRMLEHEQGPNMGAWRLPAPARPFSPNNFLGIPQTYENELLEARIEQNRGTENNMIIFADGGIVGYEVTPPGQSAFIAPDGTKAPHFTDQFELYQTFGKKRMWFYPEDVEKNKESEIVLKYPAGRQPEDT